MKKASMKDILVGAVLVVLGTASERAFSETFLDPALEGFIRGRTEWTESYVVVMLKEVEDGTPLPFRYEKEAVSNYLTAKVVNAWRATARGFESENAGYRQVRPLQLNMINNSVTLKVTARGLKLLMTSPYVHKIYLNGAIEFEAPVSWDFAPGLGREGGASPPPAVPYDLKDSGMEELFKTSPGLCGEGVVLGSVDTGIDGQHKELAGKVIAFFDGKSGKRIDSPYDSDSHGTHTVGTMIGGTKDTLSRIGVAPCAKMAGAAGLQGFDSMLKAMEYMLDPDGKPETKDAPIAVNNSWHCRGAPDLELFYKAIVVWEASGIVPVFSAGNAGPGPGTITPPKEHPTSFSVGATGPDGKVTDFSSRGHATYKGQKIEKPEITAPGKDIYSSLPGGGYGNMSGTSMAAPHVTGTIAILKQAAPSLNPGQIRQILIKSARPVDESGASQDQQTWNKSYGFGKLNVAQAVKLATQVERNGFFRGAISDIFSGLLSSPEEQELDLITDSGQGLFDLRASFMPSEYQGEGWLTRKDLGL